ncbi:TIGR03087 family PEP-CTERM/XrtA system glycosyltransferase [Methylicorpusculum oleiharenae]|uniref:TIGR03087 family PEP-CTERM/XrtA system glycosyltransferase n=1 Tax=Methylicorpusculum oleiharenae TaxID=1338687 RepID=UPI001359911A|nr:TIGR03087 family PEP-CTERM/XrtA system glycosyltransferase [Methylicorpusculum oleiharenae]MCD2451845.1 TIGR03087 family PEP-CTERM/XrtA system glycosyltransferase [Methylicorpusculum oleiharenae]
MEKLLFLVHRLPYPPNKGDKIRSFHFLKALSQRYEVYLGTFVDDPEDWQYEKTVKSYCQETCIVSLNPRLSKVKSLSGLLLGQALSIPYYKNTEMQDWIDQTLTSASIKKVLIFSSVMAQFVLNKKELEIITDYVDVDSDKWRQYALKKKWPESWIYRRESEKLLTFERQVISRSAAGIFVSEQEAAHFQALAPEYKDRIGFVNNGVDTDYFSPLLNFPSPFKVSETPIVFTGAMDYWANVDAVVWFAKVVFPTIYSKNKSARFYIVGSKPAKEVLALSELPGIVITGRVEDVRPYLAFAALVVAPLRIARGIQNKVLEAMAMEKTVLGTVAAIEGIPVNDQLRVFVEDDPLKTAELVGHLLTDKSRNKAETNRQFVIDHFSWYSSTEKLISIIN